MLAAIPAASAWQRRDVIAPPLREFLPAVVLDHLRDRGDAVRGPPDAAVLRRRMRGRRRRFQDDIAGRADAFSPGADAVHTEGLSQALTHYGDDAFPYYFFSTHASGRRDPAVHDRP